jgi:hypothetical protein
MTWIFPSVFVRLTFKPLFLVITNQNHNHYEAFGKCKNCS